MIREYPLWIRDTLPGQLVVMSNEINHVIGRPSFSPEEINRAFFKLAKLKNFKLKIRSPEFENVFVSPEHWEDYICMIRDLFNADFSEKTISVYEMKIGNYSRHQIVIEYDGDMYSVHGMIPMTVKNGEKIFEKKY